MELDTREAARGDNGINSVQRAMRILTLVAERGSVGVTEVAADLNVHKSTASRLLATLAAGRFLERDQQTRRFNLGATALRLSGSGSTFSHLVQLSRPILQRLAHETAATVNLGGRSGDQAVQLDQVDDPRAIATVNWVGQDTPLHCTSDGKVLLAFAPDDVIERVLATPLVRYTASTITDPKKLRAELRAVRRTGIGRSMGELMEGLNGVAAAIRGADGTVNACVAVSGPSFVVNPKVVRRFEKACADAAQSISLILSPTRSAS